MTLLTGILAACVALAPAGRPLATASAREEAEDELGQRLYAPGGAGPAVGATPFDTLEIQSVVESRFRRLAMRGGIKIRRLASGNFECVVRVAPAHDASGRPRLWRRTELGRMVRAIVSAIQEGFPSARVADSTRVEAPIPGVRAPLTVTLGDITSAHTVEEVSVDDLVGRADSDDGQDDADDARAARSGAPTHRILMHPEADGFVAAAPVPGSNAGATRASRTSRASLPARAPAAGTMAGQSWMGAPGPARWPVGVAAGQTGALPQGTGGPIEPAAGTPASAGPVTTIQGTGGPIVNIDLSGRAGQPAGASGAAAGVTAGTAAPAAGVTTPGAGAGATATPGGPGANTPTMSARWRAEHEIPAGAPMTGLTTGLVWPKDAETAEWAVERAVTAALQPSWPEVHARAKLLRPRLVRVNVRVVVSGAQVKDNLSMLLQYMRDTVYTVMREQFPGLNVFGRSQIELVEQTGGLVRSYRLHDGTPIVDDLNPPDPFFRTLAVERARVVDLPRAWPLPPRSTALELRGFDRHVVAGVYSNVSTSRANLYGATMRRSFFENLELSIGALSYEQTVQPTAKGVFTNSPGGLFAATFGAKYMLPYQINGMNLSIGIDQTFQPGGERQFYLPDEFERLYDVYAVASGRLWENLLLHLAAQQTFITEKPTFADATISTLGVGLEYSVAVRAVLGLELKYDLLSPSTVANFGTETAGTGLIANALVVFGTSIGDLELSMRKLNVPEWKEVGFGLAYRF